VHRGHLGRCWGGRFKPVESCDDAAGKEVVGRLARHQFEVLKVPAGVLPVVVDVVQQDERLQVIPEGLRIARVVDVRRDR